MTNITGIRTRLFIGNQEFFRVPEYGIEYRRHAHLSQAWAVLPDATGEIYRSVKKNDSIAIHMGYRDQDADIWTGTLTRFSDSKKDQILINAIGIEYPLTQTIIKNSWMNESPESIVRYSINQTGMQTGIIDSTGIVFPRFIASDKPVWQVVRQCEHTCNKAFGMNMDSWDLWVDKDGLVNWSMGIEPCDIPVIATAGLLIKHTPSTGQGTGLAMVETFLMPGFRRCGEFKLKDIRRGINNVFRARIVKHVVRPDRVRTYIWYGDEYGKY